MEKPVMERQYSNYKLYVCPGCKAVLHFNMAKIYAPEFLDSICNCGTPLRKQLEAKEVTEEEGDIIAEYFQRLLKN